MIIIIIILREERGGALAVLYKWQPTEQNSVGGLWGGAPSLDLGLQKMAVLINDLVCQEIKKDVRFPSLGTQERQTKTSYFGSFTREGNSQK